MSEILKGVEISTSGNFRDYCAVPCHIVRTATFEPDGSYFTMSWHHFTFLTGYGLRSVNVVSDQTPYGMVSTHAPAKETYKGVLDQLIPDQDLVGRIMNEGDFAGGLYFHSEVERRAFSFVHDQWFPDDEESDSLEVSHLHFLKPDNCLNNNDPTENIKMLWWCNNKIKGKVYFLSSNTCAWTEKADLIRFKMTF